MRPVGSKYLLEEPLGRGATGTVWRGRVRGAENEAQGAGPGEAVAVKVLREELAGDPDVVMRFLRERSVLLRLRHPHIVRVRDLVVEGDLLALVMDLIDGPDLHRYLRENGPFSPIGASLLTAAVADALAASHADGVVHRDLKPANVLLATVRAADGTEQMHPMLTDFGIARLADSPGVTRTHEFVGTPAYVAPESAQGRPQTSAVDVYGAGIMLYELVTGRPPFRGESAIEVLQHHLNDEPRRPTTVPEPLWTVIERCLRKDPDQRPSAESLARALRVVAAGVGVHASPAAAEAALGVAALLGPDPDPAPVPGTAGLTGLTGLSGDADPTQVLPSGSAPGNDPNAATSVLPSGGAPGAPGSGGDPTRVLPPTVRGSVPAEPPTPPQAPGPHPWESQLNAARHRNEQTEPVFLTPDQDPLRRRPQRQPQQQPYPPQGYGQGGQGGQGYEQGYDRGRPAPAAARPAPRAYQQPQHYDRPPVAAPPAPDPGRIREPREPREPRRRSANPVHIPGLGCLKGCFVVVLVLLVIFVVVWYTTPLPDWVNSTRNLWDASWHWFHQAYDKISSITGGSGSGGSGGSGNG
ncbi:serine/threonine-protein kinase [Actinacidiphila acididurans]|uniref:non-specific serine/threonine protein kinase n=1 Tax=Actinacidiphila acididurans TaxID=2784346 RepID=A0ABS2U0K0_9ACTN|nr:serine/threonine-protein kinase [Actinacidiphila acididurans]MBM9508857.1 serine/threonine protein kinase [Actinacidiphila acididurans]